MEIVGIRDKKCLDCKNLILRRSTRCYSCSAVKNRTGKIPWNKGKIFPYKQRPPLSEEAKNKIKNSILYRKNKNGFIHSEETRNKIRIANSGSKCNFWKGGITPINLQIRNSHEMKEWRQSVFERDNWTCLWCNQKGGVLNADHIKPFSTFPELRFKLSNGRTLCRKCHEKTDTWKKKALNYK